MNEWVFFALLLIGWMLIVPILAIVSFIRAGAARREALSVRREMEWMRRQLHGTPAAEAPPQSVPHFQARPETEPVAAATAGAQESLEAAKPAYTEASRPSEPATRSGMNVERMIAANWMIWAGGLALAIGGLFLVRVAIDAGLLGPLARLIVATLLGAGLIVAAFRASGMALIQRAQNAVRFLPHILSGAGVITLFGAAIGAGYIYGFVPPLIAFGLFILVSVLAIALSLRFGPLLAALGLSGAYIAPVLTGSDGGSLVPLLPYFAIVTGAALALVRLKGWRFLNWIGLIGAGFWGMVAAVANDTFTAPSIVAYALVLGAVGLLTGGHDADRRLSLPQTAGALRRFMAGLTQTQLSAYMFWILAGTLILLAGFEHSKTMILPSGLALYGGLSLFASWRRAGYVLITPIGALVTLACLIVWPGDKASLAYACLAAGIGFGIGGAWIAWQVKQRAPIAAASALMPPASLFVAFWRGGDLATHFGWGLAALAVSALLAMLLDVMRRSDPELITHKGAAASYALGASLSAILAPFLMLSGMWLGAALAVVAAMIAFILRRFDLPLLRLFGPLTVALGTALLIRPGMLSAAHISATPILNEMTFGFGIAIAALVWGAMQAGGRARVRRAYEAGAMILGFSLLGLTIRHIAGGGQLNGPFDGMGEASAYAIAYFGMSASFAWRFRGANWLWRMGEYVAVLIGLGGMLMAFIEIGKAPVGDLPVLNLLLPAFAMPALLLAVYAAALRRTQRITESRFAGAAAMLTGFIWVSLEVARTIGGPNLREMYNDAAWAYSPAWIAYAFALLFRGVWKERTSARFASLAILLLAIGKVFLIDMGTLDGVARAGSFIGLGVALIGVALFYQRYIFGGSSSTGSLPAKSPL